MGGKNSTPTPNGENGRDPKTGQFVKGWKGGPGNPLNKGVHYLKEAILQAATPEKARELMEKCHELAMAGDMAAARVWFDRAIGKPDQRVELKGDIQHTVAQTREGLRKIANRLEEAEIQFN